MELKLHLARCPNDCFRLQNLSPQAPGLRPSATSKAKTSNKFKSDFRAKAQDPRARAQYSKSPRPQS